MILSDLPEILPKLKTQSELLYALVLLDKEYKRFLNTQKLIRGVDEIHIIDFNKINSISKT